MPFASTSPLPPSCGAPPPVVPYIDTWSFECQAPRCAVTVTCPPIKIVAALVPSVSEGAGLPTSTPVVASAGRYVDSPSKVARKVQCPAGVSVLGTAKYQAPKTLVPAVPMSVSTPPGAVSSTWTVWPVRLAPSDSSRCPDRSIEAPTGVVVCVGKAVSVAVDVTLGTAVPAARRCEAAATCVVVSSRAAKRIAVMRSVRVMAPPSERGRTRSVPRTGESSHHHLQQPARAVDGDVGL